MPAPRQHLRIKADERCCRVARLLLLQIRPVPCLWASFLQLSRTATSTLLTCTGLSLSGFHNCCLFSVDAPAGRAVHSTSRSLQAHSFSASGVVIGTVVSSPEPDTWRGSAGLWVHLLVSGCASDQAAGPTVPICRKPHGKGVSGRVLASPAHLAVPTADFGSSHSRPPAEALRCVVVWAAPAKDSDGFVTARPGVPAMSL